MSLIDGHVEFGGWVIHLEAQVQADPTGYDAAIYNENVYDDGTESGMWVTIDCQLVRVNAAHGGEIDQIPGARASLGRLTADLYDPNRLLDPNSGAFDLLTRPGCAVRLVAIAPWDSSTRVLWTGLSEKFEHNLKDGTGQLIASDHIVLFTGVDITDWERPAEYSAARLAAVVDLMPNPVPLVWSGGSPMLSAAKFSGDLWSAVVETTSEAEQSIVWIDNEGRLRRADNAGVSAPVRATDCDDGSTSIIYTDLTSVIDDDVLANVVNVERVNLPESLAERAPLTYSNAASVNANGPHTLTKTGLALPDDAALAVWANQVLALRSTPTPTITGMQVTISDIFPWAFRTATAIANLTIGYFLDVTLASRGPEGRWVVAVSGIEHTITPDSWVIDITTIDGPRIAMNWGYDDERSIYDESKYSAIEGAVGPGIADIEAALVRVLSEGVTA